MEDITSRYLYIFSRLQNWQYRDLDTTISYVHSTQKSTPDHLKDLPFSFIYNYVDKFCTSADLQLRSSYFYGFEFSELMPGLAPEIKTIIAYYTISPYLTHYYTQGRSYYKHVGRRDISEALATTPYGINAKYFSCLTPRRQCNTFIMGEFIQSTEIIFRPYEEVCKDIGELGTFASPLMEEPRNKKEMDELDAKILHEFQTKIKENDPLKKDSETIEGECIRLFRDASAENRQALLFQAPSKIAAATGIDIKQKTEQLSTNSPQKPHPFICYQFRRNFGSDIAGHYITVTPSISCPGTQTVVKHDIMVSNTAPDYIDPCFDFYLGVKHSIKGGGKPHLVVASRSQNASREKLDRDDGVTKFSLFQTYKKEMR